MTGMSCGVDSMDVFANHPEVTHALIFSCRDGNWRGTDDSRKSSWQSVLAHAQKFANSIGVELIGANTNLDGGIFPGYMYEYQTTFPMLFAIFAIQKIVGRYYIASSYSIEDFRLNPITEDNSRWEPLFLPLVSLGRMEIVLDGIAKSRLDKVKELIDYKPCHNHLYVCPNDTGKENNCSRCWKCKATMLNIASFGEGALEKFSKAFDVEYFKTHAREFVLSMKEGWYVGEIFYHPDMKHYFLKHPIHLSLKDKIWVEKKFLEFRYIRFKQVVKRMIGRK